MALIRGQNCDFPCPVCLAAKAELAKGKMGNLQTTESMKEIYDQAAEIQSTEERNGFLQGYGLRFIEVCIILYQSVLSIFIIKY